MGRVAVECCEMPFQFVEEPYTSSAWKEKGTGKETT